MQYLMIENCGVCDVEGFTILGLSESRDDESKIGQFGSGNKHGVLALIRAGLSPTIYLGLDTLQFSVLKKERKGAQWNQVVYSLNNNEPKELSMSLTFGELDWNSVDMSLREFISNALDAANGNRSQIFVGLVDESAVRGMADKTRVFVPATPEILRYYHNLSDRFLHFAGLSNQTLIEKKKPGKARIYRLGVFVREIDSMSDSVYHYNFGTELRIDEARNLDDYSCADAARKVFRQGDGLTKIFRRIVRENNFWEARFNNYGLSPFLPRDKEAWVSAWKAEYGDTLIATETIAPMLERLTRKGFKVKIIHSEAWYEAMATAGIPTALSMMDDVNEKGDLLLSPTPKLMEQCKRVWAWLADVGMDKGKEMPKVKMFRSIMEADSVKSGYYKNGTVYINEDNQDSLQTILEEMAHYITNASDCTRDFQDFAFNGWARLAVEVGG